MTSLSSMMPEFPEGRRYNSFTGFFKRTYGERLQKVVIDAGFTCPNRDGTVGRGGCSYCDNAAFHPGYSTAGKSLHLQIDEGIEFHRVRYRRANCFLAYFQSFSNTYAPLSKLKELYCEALSHPDIVGIVIGTRPDCVDEEKIGWLGDLASGKVPIPGISADPASVAGLSAGGSCGWNGTGGWKRVVGGRVITAPIVIVEYGIESCYDETLLRINRGHDFGTARHAIQLTHEAGIEMGAHIILGLPGETPEMMLEQCSVINGLPLRSIKFHQLQIVKGTAMEKEFAGRPQDFTRFTLDGYLDFFVDILERLRPDLYIERFVGEVPPRFVNETPWGLVRNAELLHMLDRRLEERDTWQGRLYCR